jgi:hypothetical protein
VTCHAPGFYDGKLLHKHAKRFTLSLNNAHPAGRGSRRPGKKLICSTCTTLRISFILCYNAIRAWKVRAKFSPFLRSILTEERPLLPAIDLYLADAEARSLSS